jgi:hypothetical protein
VTRVEFPENDLKNLNLALEQTNQLIEAHRRAIQQLDWKLGSGIGFAGLLLKFNADLPQATLAYLLCKVIATIGLIGCTALCLFGFLPQRSKNGYISPSALMGKYFQWQNEQVLATMVSTNMEVEKELKVRSSGKVTLLQWGIGSLAVSVISMGVLQVIHEISG